MFVESKLKIYSSDCNIFSNVLLIDLNIVYQKYSKGQLLDNIAVTLNRNHENQREGTLRMGVVNKHDRDNVIAFARSNVIRLQQG